MTIAAKLRRLKAERGVSAAEMSQATGIAIQTLLDILEGKTRRPHERTVRRLALYFHVSPAHFLLDEEGDAAPGLRDDLARLDERLGRVEKSLAAGPPGGRLNPGRRAELEEKYLKGGRLELRLRGPLTAADRERLLELLDEVERLAGRE
jgi:transcriptional regulator with XRE-family HTH domain